MGNEQSNEEFNEFGEGFLEGFLFIPTEIIKGTGEVVGTLGGVVTDTLGGLFGNLGMPLLILGGGLLVYMIIKK